MEVQTPFLMCLQLTKVIHLVILVDTYNFYTLISLIFFVCVFRFEDLRIRREKKKEGRKVATAEKLSPKEGHNDKVACLLFEAEIKISEKHIVKCKVKSEPISLSK